MPTLAIAVRTRDRNTLMLLHRVRSAMGKCVLRRSAIEIGDQQCNTAESGDYCFDLIVSVSEALVVGALLPSPL